MTSKHYILLLSGCLLLTASAEASVDKLLPRPQHLEMHAGKCSTIRLKPEGLYLQDELKEILQRNGCAIDSRSPIVVRTSIVPSLPKVYFNKEEAYRLRIGADGIYVDALERIGLYRGLQTLEQLLISAEKKGELEACDIIYWPSFRMRGLMHDLGRAFIPMEELKKQVRLLAQYKVNMLHLHLTEHQAWRLQSKRYPQLTEARHTTRMPGKFYTLSELQDLVRLCKELRITLIPEMVEHVRSLGKKAIAWNPGWPFKSKEVDLLHLWSSKGRIVYGTPAIDSRYHYLNHYDLFADIQMLYSSKILGVTASNTNVMGAILAIWNDRYVESPRTIMQENAVYPNMLALAERAWLGGGAGYFNAPTAALSPEASAETREAFVDFERRLLWHKDRVFAGEPFPYVAQSHAQWYISPVYPNGGDLTASYLPEEQYLKQMKAHQYAPPAEVGGEAYPYQRTSGGSGVYLRHVWGDICYGLVPNASENSTVYATAWVHSDAAMTAGLIFETQNYSRSEADVAPQQGTWDYKGSRLWVNGEAIVPPRWQNAVGQRNIDLPLANENAASRPPLQIQLQKGWNQILIKLPIGRFTLPEIRLNKWMFAAAITTPDGSKALPNLQYAKPNLK
ncbi:MAG: family 20 glycosylhydrolase [Porphyromonas sp.]|nr:family 20 glycosylhydrolase [Porphyromonas sp.]